MNDTLPSSASPTMDGHSRALGAARWMLLLATIALMVSPPLSNLFQLVLYLLVLGSSELRARVWATRREPMVIAAMAFLAVLAAGALYSAAGWQAGLASLWNWRKLLMLPLAAALMQDVAWKLRLLHVFAVTSTVAALISTVLYLLDVAYPFGPHMQDGTPGIILRNHATQGMIFGVAAFTAGTFVLLRMTRSLQEDVAWTLAFLALMANISFVTIGRSGYVVALAGVITLAIGWGQARGLRPWTTALVGLLLLATVAAALWGTPKSRARILQGVHEIQTYTQATEVTSMGIRIYFWKTTPELIAQRPLFGWGTGGFEAAYRQQVAGRPGNAGLPTSDPHNQYLKIMTEQGLVGFAVFLAFLVALLRQKASREFRMLGLGVLLAWSGTSLANSHFSTFAEGNLLYIWLGAMLVSVRPPGQARG